LVEIGSVPDARKVVTSSVERACLVQQRLWTLAYEWQLPGPDVSFWPKASVRCVATTRPKLGVKPTCRHRPTDAI